jgi:hypothetical protein
MSKNDDFWAVIATQLTELGGAATADDVLRILSKERNPYGHDSIAGDGFFAGSGGDGSVEEALSEAGWVHTWRKADYYWVMQAPNGDKITYVEGDIYRGDTALKGA